MLFTFNRFYSSFRTFLFPPYFSYHLFFFLPFHSADLSAADSVTLWYSKISRARDTSTWRTANKEVAEGGRGSVLKFENPIPILMSSCFFNCEESASISKWVILSFFSIFDRICSCWEMKGSGLLPSKRQSKGIINTDRVCVCITFIWLSISVEFMNQYLLILKFSVWFW